jgi:lipopolysaccharide/colanic/teichoic acid biosynthesis glycosyltransferase
MTEQGGADLALELARSDAWRFFSGAIKRDDPRFWRFKLQVAIKRVVAVLLVLVSLPLSLPVLVLLMVAVKLDSPGPIFFSQDQLGLRGCTIRPLKFRSMQVGAEDLLKKLLAEGGPLAEEYARHHKLKDDPRVTRVGKWLRKTSLDELPQLWNVLIGDMALVGPRPYLPRELPYMLGKEEIILLMRPGITGLWQTSGRNKTTFATRVMLDVSYVQHWSFLRDLKILVKTIGVVLSSEGSG